MLDDYKYSIGRLVVYEHSDPKLPRQSYGRHGHERTLGEIIAVDVIPTPVPHWVYSIRNVRNQEFVRVVEDKIKCATSAARISRKYPTRIAEGGQEQASLAEAIARALSSPNQNDFIRSALKDILAREDVTSRIAKDGVDLHLQVGDYIRLRGDLRKESEHLSNCYAKVLAVSDSDIAGIENAASKPGQPRLYRTLKKFGVVTSDGVETDIYDAEIKVLYTTHGRRVILNWRATTLLSELFRDDPPYNLEYDYLSDHIFSRDELQGKKRSEMAHLLASILYVKGKLSWKDYQRRMHIFRTIPKSHVVDGILEASRFDSRHNRVMTDQEVAQRQKDCFKLRRILKSG